MRRQIDGHILVDLGEPDVGTLGRLMNSLFARQLAKATKPSGNVDLDLLGQLVSSAYDKAHHDRRRTDRSIALMIEELDRLNRGLEWLVEERTAALRQREEELRVQNPRFDAALNHMSQAQLMFDSSARLMISNHRYHEIYGLSPEVARPGCMLRDLLERRGESGTFSDDVDSYVENLMSISKFGALPRAGLHLLEVQTAPAFFALSHFGRKTGIHPRSGQGHAFPENLQL